jgi:uroporphyrinogen decarboxylase
MDSRERFFTSLLRRGEPDRVPIMDLDIAPEIINSLLPGATIYDFIEDMDIDALLVLEDIPWEDVGPGVKRDHWGVLRKFEFSSMMGFEKWPIPLEPRITSEKELAIYKPPNPREERRLETLNNAIERLKSKKVIIFGHHSSLLYPWFILGTENLFRYYIENPQFAKRVIDMVVDYFLELETYAIELGADVILDGEDYCGNQGLFMSPEHFDEFVLPGLQKVVNRAKEKNIPFIKHCDGYIWPIIDRLVETGIDGLNPIEPAAGMDIGEVKKAYGDRIAVIGNIDCAHLLSFGSKQEVQTAVKECIQKASPGGGHIISSSNVIHDGVPPENYAAMINATKEYGHYPIQL